MLLLFCDLFLVCNFNHRQNIGTKYYYVQVLFKNWSSWNKMEKFTRTCFIYCTHFCITYLFNFVKVNSFETIPQNKQFIPCQIICNWINTLHLELVVSWFQGPIYLNLEETKSCSSFFLILNDVAQWTWAYTQQYETAILDS